MTIDDLPVVSTPARLGLQGQISAKLLRSIAEHRAPAIGFVSESRLHHRGARDERQVAQLRAWLDAGLELGNHTYSHLDLHATPLAAFQEDVVRDEVVTRPLLAARGKRLRYFRHPYLHTGTDPEVRRQFEAFLAARGYEIAPVTIPPSDWIFSRAYDRAFARGNPAMMERIATAYREYVEATFEYHERLSRALFGHEIREILLLHANALNADHFGALVHMIWRRGYRLVPLDRALADPAYQSPDTYTGPDGIGWLQRWGLSRGFEGIFFAGFPDVPGFVMEAAGLTIER